MIIKTSEDYSKRIINKPRKKDVTLYIQKDQMVKHKERRVDALALRAEERRDKLRKAAGRSKYPSIRRYLNGETHMRSPHVPLTESIG